MRIINLILFTFLFFMLTGCGKQKNSTPTNLVPKWYLIAPNNNALFIYGTGEGYNLKEAKNNALSDMSSRLIVSVGSVMNSTVATTSDGTYSKNTTRDTKVEVKQIKFNNVKLEKTTQSDKIIYILMKVNRHSLFDEKKRELLSEDKQLDTKYKALEKLTVLEQIFALKNLESDILKAKEKAIVLYAIKNDFNYESFIVKYDRYLAQDDKLKQSISMSVKSNDENRYFADIISQALNEKKYKLVDNNTDINIKLTNKIRYSQARGWKIAKVSTTISVSSNGKTLANTIIKTIGRSGSTNLNALNSASKYFQREVNKIGIDKILFNQ